MQQLNKSDLRLETDGRCCFHTQTVLFTRPPAEDQIRDVLKTTTLCQFDISLLCSGVTHSFTFLLCPGPVKLWSCDGLTACPERTPPLMNTGDRHQRPAALNRINWVIKK